MTGAWLQVFFKQPSLLYTYDIQRAWIHLHIGRGELAQVPPMNRLRPK